MPDVRIDMSRRTIEINGVPVQFSESKGWRFGAAVHLLRQPGQPVARRQLFAAVAEMLCERPPAKRYRMRYMADVRAALCPHGVTTVRTVQPGVDPEDRVAYAAGDQDADWQCGDGFAVHAKSLDVHVRHRFGHDLSLALASPRHADALTALLAHDGLPVRDAVLDEPYGAGARRAVGSLHDLGARIEAAGCVNPLRPERNGIWGVRLVAPWEPTSNPFAPGAAAPRPAAWAVEIVQWSGDAWIRLRLVAPVADLIAKRQALLIEATYVMRRALALIAAPTAVQDSQSWTTRENALGITVHARREPSRLVVAAQRSIATSGVHADVILAHKHAAHRAGMSFREAPPISDATVAAALNELGARIGRRCVLSQRHMEVAVVALPRPPSSVIV